MYRLHLALFLTTVLFKQVICGVFISFCSPTTTGLFPFPGNCTKYISCNQGQATVFSCTHGATFNLEFNRCDYEQEVNNCQNSIGHLKDLQILCLKDSSNLYSHPFDCKKYITCSQKSTVTRNCGPGTVFNSSKSVCDWPYNVPGCSGNLGNGFTLRGDVTLSSINLDIGRMIFESKNHVGNENDAHQFTNNENDLIINQNNQPYESNKPSLGNNEYSQQFIGYNNHFMNKPIYHESEEQPDYTVQNGYADASPQYNQLTSFGSHQQITSSENHFGNRPAYQQSNKPSASVILNPTINQYPSANYQAISNTHLQSSQSEHNGINNQPYHQSSSNHEYYSTPSHYPNQNQAIGYQTDAQYHQTMNVDKPNNPNTPSKGITTQSSSQPMRSPTKETTNNEKTDYLDIDIRIKDDKFNKGSNTIKTRNSRAGTALSFSQILAINNLADPKKMSNNKLNNYEDQVGSFSEHHGRIVNSPNNWFNARPLESIDNNIDESQAAKKVNDANLIVFKDEIKPVSTTSETPSIETVVENVPSINLLNFNYIENQSNSSVQIDQDYSKVRNHTVRSKINNDNNSNNNNDNVKELNTILKLNHKLMELRKLFSDNSTDHTFLSTLFVTPFKSGRDNQFVETINQFSGQVLRLRGGSGGHQGYIEIRGVGLVGQCDNSWNLEKAHKICHNLGYKRGAKTAWEGKTDNAELPLSSFESNVFCQHDKSEFQTCELKNTSMCSIERNIIGVECFLDSPAYCSQNDVPFHRNCYHLVDSSLNLTHENVIRYCSARNSSLLYITAQDENDFISEWLTQKYPEVESIMTAGIGFTLINRTIWMWQDSAKSLFNFMKWWPGWRNEKIIPPSVESASCIVMKNKFPCYDQPSLDCKTDGYFFWDVDDCSSSIKKYHYICKRPYNKIIL